MVRDGVKVFELVEDEPFPFLGFDITDVIILVRIIPQLIEEHECITTPYNMSPKHWIGIRPEQAPDTLIKQLVSNSYTIIKNAYTSKNSK